MNAERIQSVWYFVIPNRKREKSSDYKDLLKMDVTITKKESRGIIAEELNLENDMSLWRSGRKVST